MLVTYGGPVSEAEGSGRGSSGEHKRHQADEEPSLKFLMLNPSVHFDEIVKKVKRAEITTQVVVSK